MFRVAERRELAMIMFMSAGIWYFLFDGYSWTLIDSFFIMVMVLK